MDRWRKHRPQERNAVQKNPHVWGPPCAAVPAMSVSRPPARIRVQITDNQRQACQIKGIDNYGFIFGSSQAGPAREMWAQYGDCVLDERQVSTG